jgi:hypothetical protein
MVGTASRSRANRALRFRSPRVSRVACDTDVLLDEWDTKPEHRIRRTSPAQADTLLCRYYARLLNASGRYPNDGSVAIVSPSPTVHADARRFTLL